MKTIVTGASGLIGRFLVQRLEADGQAQFIITTHSPILLAYPNAQIFSFDSSRIEEMAYEDTTHYKIYKQFFTDRTAFLKTGRKEDAI